MDMNYELLDTVTIRAAADGEAWAVDKIVEYYSDEIDALCTISEERPDGSMQEYVDEDMRELLIKELLKAIPLCDPKQK